MISSLAGGRSSIRGLLTGLDCYATIDAFKNMGISMVIAKDGIATIDGKGLRGLCAPEQPLYLGNSGTTMRLLLGILAGQDFKATLTGDESLSKRPMKRVTDPLRLMGADIEGPDGANLAPLSVQGGRLKSIDYESPIASAQVKSSIIFAGLNADGVTKVKEPYKSRDHTERMLRLFGADLKEDGLTVCVKGMGNRELQPQSIIVPGDISAAAFFMALGILAKDSEIVIGSCGVNPTRTGVIDVLNRMKADIEILDKQGTFEPTADIIVKSSPLRSTRITKEEMPLLIDEVPVIALVASFAEGPTVIEGVGELRVKETDRVYSIVKNLKALGADIASEGDSIIIKGPTRLKGTVVESFGDHRTAMMMTIAGCIAEGKTVINNTECIETSFPTFMETLKSLTT